ncbi:NACHT and WD repeat domain-containing protein 2-like [Babylonia areolata]|uniref:NACHT and WD repeat domain-containing protein 2-like n=1 Tax=Babylonia areolata TaxID=304850 RepID=UPI003FD650EF
MRAVLPRPRDLPPVGSAAGEVQQRMVPKRISFMRKVSVLKVPSRRRSDRLQHVVKVAEDGVKRTALPPLEVDPIFFKAPRKRGLQAAVGDENEGGRRSRKVSVEVDRKIVNHLRRDLARRLEKRIQQVYDPQLADCEGRQQEDNTRPVSTKEASQEKQTTIFDQYSETGDKLKDELQRRTPSSRRGRHVKGFSSTGSTPLASGRSRSREANQSAVSRTSQSEDVFGKGTPLPGIGGSESGRPCTKGRRRVSLSDHPVTHTDSPRRESSTDVEANPSPEGRLAEQADDGPRDKESSDLVENVEDIPPEEEPASPDVNFRSMVISPVPTPVLYRPETREMTRVSMAETMTQILDGHVHRRCPPDNKIIHLYVLGGYSDTLTERTALMKHVYHKLRQFCSLHGRDLCVHDLHWGVKDSISDDHSIPEVIGRVIARCQESNMGVNLLMILGEKYGPFLIPTEIPSHEFENFVLASKVYREKQVRFIRSSIAEIEATRAERERLRQLEMETASIATTETTTTEAAALGRSESIISQREDVDDEMESTLGDSSPVKYRPAYAMARKEQAAIRALRESEEDIPDATVLEQWYRLDENRDPPVFRLQNISTEFKDIQRTDGKKRDMAKNHWLAVVNRIRKVLQTFSPEIVQSPADLKKYFTSDIEKEINRAMESEFVTSNTLCVLRQFGDACSQVTDPAGEDYLDVVGKNKTRAVHAVAARRIRVLRDEVVLRRLPVSLIKEFTVEWDPQGLRDQGIRDHVVYLERLCKHVLETCKRRLGEELADHDVQSWKGELFREVVHHVRFCHHRVQGFHGRKDILTIIKSYVRSASRLPLVLYGKTGSGKSAILSKCAKEVNKWFRGREGGVRVLVRMVGSTEQSSNVRTLLHSLCVQLCHIFGTSPADVPSDYKGVVNDLAHRLGQASEDRSLVVLIDGVDGLSDDHEGRKMTWLPRDLPPHVKLVVSTLPEDTLDCLPSLRKLLEGRADSFLEVPELPQVDAAAMVTHWLKTGGRRLTSHQFDVIMKAFAKCPVPLFLKMAYSEGQQWRSYTAPEMCRLAEGVKKLATLRFARLERDHGEPLVRRALGYVTAGRHGVTSNEMEDLLSLDEVVMDEVCGLYVPPRRRLPPVLWARLLEGLRDLLQVFSADGVLTWRWAHRVLQEAARERYLAQRDKAPSYHTAMAHYFMGTWAARPKPYGTGEQVADRMVAPQAYFLEPEGSLHDGTDRTYNLRKINELPFHLQHAQMTSELKTVALLNFDWILAKLCATSVRDLLEEYSAVIQATPEDEELRLTWDTLHRSGRALRHHPRQLASQLVGRLQGVIARDTPKGPGEKRKLPNLLKLVQSAKDSPLPALIPSAECLTPPGGVLFDLLSGHTDEITAVTVTSDGLRALTSSLDNSTKLWDLRTGRVVRTLEGLGAKVTALRTAKNNSLLVTVEVSVIKVWSLKTGVCVRRMEEQPDPAAVCVAVEGQVLVAVQEGTNTFRAWSLDTFSQLCQVRAVEGRGVHKERSVLVPDTVHNDLVLHAFRSHNAATVQHARTGQVVRTLTCHQTGSSIAAVAVSREYHVVCCRQQDMTQHEVHVLELFDARKGDYLRSVRGCVQDRVISLHINLLGTHALAVCASEKQQVSDVAAWNLETEDHKHLAPQPLTATASACLDPRFCLTAARGQNSLRVWNLSGKINQPAPRHRQQAGVAQILPLGDNPRYCLARGADQGPISVWDVARGTCLQEAVSVARGSSESDAVVVRNTRLVLLTDRGFSSHSLADSRPVFQTAIVYDLKAKKCERKLTGCYIAPAPSHEYILLDEERMLGPSETRSHLVVWSLVSGHALHRIKTNFKDRERRKLEAGAAGVALVDSTPAGKADREGSTHMTPWDRRAETKSARQRRLDNEADVERQRVEELKKEKENAIEQFIVSGDQRVLVASFYAHHLCVFDIPGQCHTQTLENDHSLLLLHVAALTHDGSHLVQANYDERDKVSYVTLWDCVAGEVKRRLKRETDVCALGISNDASRVVIGRAPNQLHVWDPMRPNSLRRARGYDGLRFSGGSQIFLQNDATRAVVFAGDISLWDVEQGRAIAVFSPDSRVLCCGSLMDGAVIAVGLAQRPDLVVLRLSGRHATTLAESTHGPQLFHQEHEEEEEGGDGAVEEEED